MTAQKPKAAKGSRLYTQGQSGIVRKLITKEGATIKVIQLNLSAEMIQGLSVGQIRLPPTSSRSE